MLIWDVIEIREVRKSVSLQSSDLYDSCANNGQAGVLIDKNEKTL